MSLILQLQGLKKSFIAPDGEPLLIIDVPEFSLEERTQVGLAGRSGSGKTAVPQRRGNETM